MNPIEENSEYYRGVEAAKSCIARGDDPQLLRNQASSDLDQDAFSRGWKKTCDEHIVPPTTGATTGQNAPAAPTTGTPYENEPPTCQKCGVLVNLRDNSEHDGYCDSCAHDQLAAAHAQIDLLKAEVAEQKSKLDYVHSMGLRFGMMESSDKPEPYLAHTWTEDSDHERMFREWTESIGWESDRSRLQARVADLEDEKESLNSAIS